jgi:energy-coupling factor transporter ATP-binding protein EcfA2
VHVQKIHIRNIRGFREVDLDLSRPSRNLAGWTVLAGRNGSGKSTLLKAIALVLAGPEVARTLQESFASWIRMGEQAAEVTTSVDLFGQSNSAAEDASPKSAYQNLSVERGSPPPRGGGATFPHGAETRFVGGSKGLSWRRSEIGREPRLVPSLYTVDPTVFYEIDDPWIDLFEEGFVAAYGPYRRLSGHATDAQRLMAGPDQVARLVSLFREDSSLVECVQWLREIYLRRLEDKPGAAELEQAVLALLNDDELLPGGLRVDGIDSEALWVSRREVRLPLDELSDGYRTVAALVMDIVRHLHRCFGELQIESTRDEEGPYQRVLHSGVILIDEVELHLHVSWQKRIGFWLKRHFPNIQFIVTTHSPFVCQAADPRGLIRLPAPGENRPVEHVSEELYYTVVNGSADDAVMTELFGLETPYSEQSEKLRDEVAHLEARLQTGKATETEEKELEELRSQLPQTPTGSIEQLLRKLTADA